MSLEIRKLVKKYGEKTVVNDLSFKMSEPGVYALLGTNGELCWECWHMIPVKCYGTERK